MVPVPQPEFGASEMERDIRELRKLLVGNGKVGFFEQVRLNDAAVKALRADIESLKNSLDMVARPVQLEESRVKALVVWGEKIGLLTAIGMGVANAMGWL